MYEIRDTITFLTPRNLSPNEKTATKAMPYFFIERKTDKLKEREGEYIELDELLKLIVEEFEQRNNGVQQIEIWLHLIYKNLMGHDYKYSLSRRFFVPERDMTLEQPGKIKEKSDVTDTEKESKSMLYEDYRDRSKDTSQEDINKMFKLSFAGKLKKLAHRFK